MIEEVKVGDRFQINGARVVVIALFDLPRPQVGVRYESPRGMMHVFEAADFQRDAEPAS